MIGTLRGEQPRWFRRMLWSDSSSHGCDEFHPAPWRSALWDCRRDVVRLVPWRLGCGPFLYVNHRDMCWLARVWYYCPWR